MVTLGNASADERARKAIRVRALTDPLGAKGLRRTRPRVERETRVRRTVFAAVVAAFVVCFGFVATSRGQTRTATAGPPIRAAAAVGQGHGRHRGHRGSFAVGDGNAGMPSFAQPSSDQPSDTGPAAHVRTATS